MLKQASFHVNSCRVSARPSCRLHVGVDVHGTLMYMYMFLEPSCTCTCSWDPHVHVHVLGTLMYM